MVAFCGQSLDELCYPECPHPNYRAPRRELRRLKLVAPDSRRLGLYDMKLRGGAWEWNCIVRLLGHQFSMPL